MNAADAQAALEPHHLAMLVEGSGIDPNVITERHYRSIRWADDLTRLGFSRPQRRTPGLLLPVWPPDGNEDLVVYRPDNPRIAKDGKILKYEVPKGAGLRIDVPPRCRAQLGDPAIPLWVTEGVKKSDSLASHGLCAIALLGVWGFLGRNRTGGVTLTADLDHIALKGRVVRIVFDSDVATKSAVRVALERFREHLQRKGATIEIVYLPNGPDATKVGVDDYLLEHTIAELGALAQGPRPAPQPAPQQVRLLESAPPRLDRPLALMLDGHAYAATWLYVEVTTSEELNRSGEVVHFAEPRVSREQRLAVVRDDGHVFGIDAQEPLEQLGFDVQLREPLRQKHAWDVRGVARYRAGARPHPADVFRRLVDTYDHFLDFSRSLASQRVMSRVMACMSLVTWLASEFDNVAYFQPTGEAGAGKTKLVELWIWTSYLGQMVTSGSSFATLRDLADYGGALGIDDAEFLADPKKVDPHLRELILSGYRKSGSEIGVKEPGVDGAWMTRWVRTYSPRAFSAIRLPDVVLGSRTISIPLVKSTDKAKADRLPDHSSTWPTDRARLMSDLWALALELLPRARTAWDEASQLATNLWGRDLEPWRPLLTVASLMESAGAEGLLDDVRRLMGIYQRERSEFTAGRDLHRLMAEVLADMAKTAVWEVRIDDDRLNAVTGGTVGALPKNLVMRVVPSGLARAIQERVAEPDDGPIQDAEGLEKGGKLWPSAEQIGRALQLLRLGKRHRQKRERWWEISREDLEQFTRTHGVMDVDDA